MEYSRVRRPLLRSESGPRLGGGGGGGGGGPGTKAGVVGRRLRRVATARAIVGGLQRREVVANGESHTVQGPSPARAASEAGRARSATEPGAGAKRSELHMLLQQREQLKTQEEVVERARRRYEERRNLKAKLRQDMDALKTAEEEKEKAKRERMREVFQRERALRAEQLEKWRLEEEKKEQKQKRLEEKRREKERKAREQALKERQQRYQRELRERERLNRHKREDEAKAAEREEIEASRRRSNSKKPHRKPRGGVPGHKTRLQDVVGSYDPRGKLRIGGGRRKKAASKMSDTEIVELARQIVQDSKIHNSDTTARTVAQGAAETSIEGLEFGLAAPTGNQDPEEPLEGLVDYEPGKAPAGEDEIEAWYRQQLESV